MRKLFLSLLCLIAVLPAFSQIEFPGSPWSLEYKLESTPRIFLLDVLTDKVLKSYTDQVPKRYKSLIFAYPYRVNISSRMDGLWEKLPNGRQIWRTTIISEGARSLNLIFSRFHLPEGARMFLYSAGYKEVRGAFTNLDELPSGILATVPLQGDNITIELDVPANVTFEPILELMQVSHEFKGNLDNQNSNTAGACNVDINCPAGADWQIEKRAVVKFIRGGVWLCSGTLINNTANNGKPLLLTANHCIGLDWHAEQSVFYFRYEKPGCGIGIGSLQNSLSGSRLLATTNKLDFTLVELSSQPPKSYDPYYAGWDRRVLTYLDSVVCIHHASGDVKKISKSFHRVVTGDFGGGFDANTHWKISQWDIGTTEGGSSGSGLFNTDHRVVGDLTGGDASCSYNFNDYFQKLSVAWDKYPDSTNQLKYWLDPDKTGVQSLNGYDPFSGGKPLANFEVRPEIIQTGKKAYLTDKSAGAPDSWSWSIPGGTPERLSGNQPAPVVFHESGQYSIHLKVSNSLGRDSVKRTVKVFDYPVGQVSENRIVPGRTISFSDASKGSPLSVNWRITPADPSIYSGKGPVEVTLSLPGEYSTEQIVEFPEFFDTLVHYNHIKVISEGIAFSSLTVTNITPEDHTGYLSMGTQGYFPGSNGVGVTAFAEAFRNTGDTAYMITGITVQLERLAKWASGYYLPVVVWNANKQPVIRDSIMISNFRQDSHITVWLKSPVNFDTLNYAGFEIRPWDQGTFYSRMAIDRGIKGVNSAYAIKGSQWLPLTDLIGVHTSLDVSLETAYLRNSYSDEIHIIPNSNNGQFQIDLGKLVFKSVRVNVFNLSGQQIRSETEERSNRIELQVHPPVSGIYLIRLTIDGLDFNQKVVVIKE